MHFILISKKESFQDKQINVDLLNSPNAPSLISREAIKFDISNFIIYLYPYNHIDKEVYGYSYYFDDDKFLLCNGLVNIDDSLRDRDLSKFFEELNKKSKLIGDYQLISIDKNGDGSIKTPSISIRKLFYYEDENCTVLSTEIKLIVDGVLKFKENTFVNHYDLDFINDAIFREWIARDNPRHTIFKEIRRVFPHDIKYFNEGKIKIEKVDSIKIPKWFRNAFNNDKTQLYDFYYQFLINFAEMNLVNLKPNIEKIIMGLTGGLDSRLAGAIISKVCKTHNISLLFYTSGRDTHPDVIIAKKIAKTLEVEHFHHISPIEGFPNSKDYKDYELTFYMAQGDWNSKDFVSYYDRKLASRISPLINKTNIDHSPGIYPVTESEICQQGMDAFKRSKMYRVLSANTWYSRRILFYQNFFFPLFFTDYEVWFALLYGEKAKGERVDHSFKEFVHEILKRSEPKLLDIPFAGDSLPQVKVKPYLRIEDSKHHDREPFLWDYEYVKENLKPILTKNLDQLDRTEKSFLKLVGLNELDYFFNKEINVIIKSYQEKKIDLEECFRRLLRERSPKKYSRSKSMLTRSIKSDEYINKMQILMDFASVANKKSFQEIEKDIGV